MALYPLCDRFSPSPRSRGTTMASADFCTTLVSTSRCSLLVAMMQISLGIAHSPSRLCLSDLRHSVPCKNWALHHFACLPRLCPLYPLPVRKASVLPSASFRFRPRGGHPCCSADTSPCRACRGLSPPSECAPGAQMKKRAGLVPARFTFVWVTAWPWG
jgi:hypothetical protein